MSGDAPPANDSMEHEYIHPDDLLHYQQPYSSAAGYTVGSNHTSQDHWNATHSFPETVPPFAELEHSPRRWITNGVEEQQYWPYNAQWPTPSPPQMIPIPFEAWPEQKPTLLMQPVRIPEMVQIPEVTENAILPQRGRGRAPIHHTSRSRHLMPGDNIENALGEFALARSTRPKKYRNTQEVNADNGPSPRSGSSVPPSASRDPSDDPA
jgi:hypothetical protein